MTPPVLSWSVGQNRVLEARCRNFELGLHKLFLSKESIKAPSKLKLLPEIRKIN